ncbi:MAG: 3-dehydroquinate synthase [Alphaproteobacteria bacterium]|nr:3-dehydroquinate synthase [Alphaproteobacteria bacterium]
MTASAAEEQGRCVVNVAAASASYDIIIGAGVLAQAGEKLAAVLPGRRAIVVTDENVAGLYLQVFSQSLRAAGFSLADPVILPPGEETKNFSQLQHIIESCLAQKLDRKSAVIALGGGVVGDIAGFAASMLMRGVNFVQVPTTLLAQVDSSVGGKTAVNTKQGKNLAGAFYQPKIVLIDTEVLKTLPAREMKAGYAEVLKYALINDPAFFEWLDGNHAAVLSGDAAALSHAIAVSCRAKAEVVAADEREEKDIRALLNLGHTFGHALEALGGYDGRLLHGEAVGIGLGLAYGFSAAQGICPPEDAARVERHLSDAGLMTSPPFAVTAAQVLEKMRGDKKASEGKMTLVLAKGIGQAFVAKDADEGAVLAFLQARTGT